MFSMIKDEKVILFTLLSSAVFENGLLKITLSKEFVEYFLSLKEKNIQYGIENLIGLSSKYTIRLYKLLKEIYIKNFNGNDKFFFKISINKLKSILKIPDSYQYSSGIKKRILEKAKIEFKEYTDIVFNYEEIKNGKAITDLTITAVNTKRFANNSVSCRHNKKSLQIKTSSKRNSVTINTNYLHKEIITKKDYNSKSFEKNFQQNENSGNISKQINLLIDKIKDFYIKNNLTLTAQRFIYEKFFYTKLVKEKMDFDFIKNIIDFAINDNFYKTFLANPATFSKHFDAIVIKYNTFLEKQKKNDKKGSYML